MIKMKRILFFIVLGLITTVAFGQDKALPIVRAKFDSSKKYVNWGIVLTNNIGRKLPENALDENGDGKYDLVYLDEDGDGTIEKIVKDSNGDGIIDSICVDADFEEKKVFKKIDKVKVLGPFRPWTWTREICSSPPGQKEFSTASSTFFQQGNVDYRVENICDDDPTTAWMEGKADDGLGEFFEIDWLPIETGNIFILNGNQASKNIWENNNRVKKMKVSFDGVDLFFLELGDVMGVQEFTFPPQYLNYVNGDYLRIRFTILEVYPGLKFKNTGISGIFSCRN